MVRRPHRKNTLTETIGWIGVILIVLAYILLSTGIVIGRSIPYQAMMLLGSASIAYEAWSKRDKQPMVLNLVFMSIAFMSLIGLFVNQ